MYNPVVGRWISRDPLGQSDGGPEVVYSHEYVTNRMRAVLEPYAYVRNNPLNMVDPSGMVADELFGWGNCWALLLTCPDIWVAVPIVGTRLGIIKELSKKFPRVPGGIIRRRGIGVKDSSQANALMHCTAYCRPSKLIGPRCALTASACREDIGGTAAQAIDLHNDAVGSCKCLISWDCADCCKAKLDDGTLTWKGK
jgi:RHS repeat-associated protein